VQKLELGRLRHDQAFTLNPCGLGWDIVKMCEFDGLLNELFVSKSNQQGTQVWTTYTVFEKQRFASSKLVASIISKIYSELNMYIATHNGWCIINQNKRQA